MSFGEDFAEVILWLDGPSVGRFLKPHHGLDKIDLNAMFAVEEHGPEHLLALKVSGFRRLAKPLNRLFTVLRYALAKQAVDSKLSVRQGLLWIYLDALEVPLHCRFIVLLRNTTSHALAAGVHRTQVNYGDRISLACGPAEPLHRCHVVFLYAQAIRIHYSNLGLSMNIPLVPGQAGPLERLERVRPSYSFAVHVHFEEIERGLCMSANPGPTKPLCCLGFLLR